MTRRRRSRMADFVLHALGLGATLLGLLVLAVLLADVLLDGLGRVSRDFLTGLPSRRAENAGIFPALAGTVRVIALTAVLAVPVGVGAAVYLEEYGDRGWWTRLIEINVANLAGVPSVVYGLLGLGLFVRTLGLGRSVLAGAATLALLVLPVVVLSSREALRAVPPSLREASCALGATRWQTVRHQVLPAALPGMLTGTILALSRAIGEAAPLIAIGALACAPSAPDGIRSPFTVLPIQVFDWVSRPEPAFIENAAAGIIVLLALLLAVNGLAAWLRDRYRH